MADAFISTGGAEAANPPDWSAIEGEFPCPLCRYNLRGLNVPRCPECGYRFEWKEVLDPNRREHPYLFEHHPERNLWSFRKTARGALRPKRFWTSLHPVMPSRPGRLLAYWVITAVPFVALASVVLFAPDIIEFVWSSSRGPGIPFMPIGRWYGSSWSVRGGYSWVWDTLEAFDLAARRQGDLLWMLLGTVLVWPVLTLASLMVFRWSMARAKVRPIHVARCVAYSFDMTPATRLAAMILLLLGASVLSPTWSEWCEPLLLLLWLATIGFCWRRLRLAYALYLRFDRPFLTVFASQAIVLLAVLNVIAAMDTPWLRRLGRAILP